MTPVPDFVAGARALLAASGCTIDGEPAVVVRIAELNDLVARVHEAEAAARTTPDNPAVAAPATADEHDELWSLLDWSLWGAGMGDVLREPLADAMVGAITAQQRADALRVMAASEESGRIPVGRHAYEQLKADRDRLAATLDGLREVSRQQNMRLHAELAGLRRTVDSQAADLKRLAGEREADHA